MGAGCCRARVLPGPGPGPHALPPRPIWASAAPDPSIANLRPGDKFHFNREQFIRQHLVVPEKASSNGVHNPAFTSDGGVGVLAVRPALPSLPTPPPSPVPVPPPRKKRRARPPQQHQHQHQHQLQQHQHQHQLQQQQPHGPPPLPPSRSRAGTRSRGKDGQSEDDDESAINPNDSILSPAHTMELLKRMAKMEARRARSMDSLEVLDVGVAARGRSLPGRGSAPEHYYQQHPDGPRSLDLDLNKEGVVGVAGFSLQSWEERRGGRWSVGASAAGLPSLSSSAPSAAALQLLSPRQWRPLSPSDSHSPPSSSSPRASSPHQVAATKALSEFIRDTYAAQVEPVGRQQLDVAAIAPSSHADPAAPVPAPAPAPAPAATPASAPTAGLVGSGQEEAAAASAASLTADDETGECVPQRAAAAAAPVQDASPDGDRPGSSASSTTESLEELGDDILHMLSSTSDKAESEAGDEVDPLAESAERRTTASAALPSSELVRHQQRQYSLGEAAAATTASAARDIVPVS